VPPESVDFGGLLTTRRLASQVWSPSSLAVASSLTYTPFIDHLLFALAAIQVCETHPDQVGTAYGSVGLWRSGAGLTTSTPRGLPARGPRLDGTRESYPASAHELV
jgi:hypothetical protein